MATGLLNSNHENLPTGQNSFKTISLSSSSSELAISPNIQPETKVNGNSAKSENTKSFKIEIPRISSSRDIQPQRPHSPCQELEQRSFLFNGSGSKRDANKQLLKIKSVELEEAVKKAKKYAMEQSVRFALVKQQQQQQKQQLDLIKKQQALLLMCRIYVGSIFYEVKEEAVKTAFGAFGPIRSITMSWDAATNKHKGFAFIEFETPEAAQLAYEQMNGALLGGRNIKVGRPSNMPQAQPIIDQMTEEAKNHHRIYVASIHSELTEQDVQSVFEAFGTIKSCHLIRDIQTGKHKGYGFIEFEKAQSSLDAIASMNQFDLGGQLLRVGKAVTPPEIVSSQVASHLTGLNPLQTSGGPSSVTSGLAAQLQDIGVFNPINSSTSLLSASTSSSNLLATGTNKSSSTNLTVTNTQTASVTTTASVSEKQSATQSENHQVKLSTSTTQVKASSQPNPSPVPATMSTEASAATNQTQQTQQSALESLSKIELTENQKKLLGMTGTDDSVATLEQQSELTVKGKEQRLLLMQKLMRRRPETKILVLRNMVGPDDVDEDLEIEITEECEKFGEVDRVVIYQEKQGEEENAEIIVKIFVEFTNPRSVESAIGSLNGRYFAGRVVKAETYDQAAYDSKDYSARRANHLLDKKQKMFCKMAGISTETNAVAPFYNQNQERYESLSIILQTAVQRTYHQLMIMVEMFPELSDNEKKIKIIAYACKTRQLFMRIYALVKFIKTAHINVSNILSFLDQQAFIFVDTADFLYHLARVKLVNARLPSFSILTSVDVLTLGTYPRLPTCVKDRILPPEKIKEEEKERTLETLNRIIQCRLALSELPGQLKNFKIENGFVKFQVKNEFEVKLTLISDDFKLPWRLLKVTILVKDSQDPNRPLVHNFQINLIHNVLQMRLNENNRPLVDLYQCMHFFTQSLQLEILLDQMTSLNKLTTGKFYEIAEYQHWKKLSVKYWLEYSKQNQYDFKFSLCVAENSDYLQTTHYPPLHWRDHKNIDIIFKTDELLIEKIVNQIIKFRSKKRLMEVQSAFENINYCKATLIEDKPALKIQFFVSNFQNETLWIMIDYYSGLFQVLFPHSISNPNLKQSIESCMNTDLKKLEPILFNLRIWLLLKRCKTIIRSYGFKCHDELNVISFANNQLSSLFTKLDKNRIFVELKKQEKVYIMVTIRSKEELTLIKDETSLYENSELLDNQNSLSFNYYILCIAKCKYDGELDPTKPFLKLVSLSHFKRNATIAANIDSTKFFRKRALTFGETSSEFLQTDNFLHEFVNMVFYIEERLPYLSFMKILNKQNIVTQNIQSNPEILPILSLSLISVPTIPSGEFSDAHYMEKLSKELYNSLLSFTVRQKQFKEYLNTGLPTQSYSALLKSAQVVSLSKFLFAIEFTFNNGLLIENLSQKIDIYSTLVEANNLDSFYDSLKFEWVYMCRMYSLIKEVKIAFQKYPELNKQMKIKKANFKKLVLKYGPSLAYTIQFSWSKETKSYEILLDVDSFQSSVAQVDKPITNYHVLFLNEIKKYFSSTKSVVNLVQILNYSCVTTFGLAKLSNLPKFYSKVSHQTILANSGFMLIICSLTHFKLTYYSKYCLDVHIKPNGLVSIRDGSFALTDINAGIEELHPIQFLSAFLNLFLDENVQELLRRRSSLVEDDNPTSPAVSNYNLNSNNSMMQQQPYSNQPPQQHIFLPPTSPAVQSRVNIPTPSPIQNFCVQSPGMSAPTSNAPIAQSPSFTNFGSPAIPHSSPSTNPQLLNNNQVQQQHSTSIQSPSGFMSPAAASQAQSYSIQSPANFSELSLQSPLQSSIPIKSPFVGPSPSTNIPSLGSNYGFSKDMQEDQPKMAPQKSQQIPNFSNTSSSSLLLNYHQYKKCHSASIPIYLSEAGFLKMITVNPDINYSPLEVFLASCHLKKMLIKTIQNDSSSFQVKNHEANIYKTYFVEFQITSDISPNYLAFSVGFIQINNEIQVDTLQKYFNAKILCPPFKSAIAISFLNLLAINEPKILKEFIQLLDYELNPALYKSQWRIKFSWNIPNGYNLKNQKSNLLFSFYQTSLLGFQRKDKYYFLLYLFNQQRVQSPNSLPFILLLISYETQMNNFQFDILKPVNDNNPIYNAYDNYIGSLVNSARQKEMNNYSLFSIINEIIYSLPGVINVGPNMPQMR